MSARRARYPGDDHMTTTTTHTRAVGAPEDTRRPYAMLGVAAVGFALTFWAWALLSPLGAHFKQTLGLSSFQQALVVAVPVIVGSLGRIPVGALTDRFGGRKMFPVVAFASILPVLFLGLAGYRSLTMLLIGAFFLGLAGTSFAVGVPFVNAWFPPERRGMAIGIFGMGMGGTAISALTTVKLVTHWGIHAPFLIVASVLAVYGVIAAVVVRDAPGRPVPSEPAMARLASTLKLRITWQASALYAVGFGGFVAFSVYLPTYLKNAYLLTQTDAANKMAGFVLLAVVMRPVGGWLSDRLAPAPVLAAAFALVAQRAPAQQVGAVTGVVGAAGGLGGFVPPLVMGSIYGATGSYAWGLIALAVVAAGAMGYSVAMRRHAAMAQAA